MKDCRRSCTICNHPDRVRIEMARLAGCSLSAIAERFNVSRDAVHRHMAKHVSDADRAALVVDIPIEELRLRAAEESTSLLDYLAIARKQLLDGMLITRDVQDWSRHSALQGRFIELLRLQGSLSGELRQFVGAVVNNTMVVLTASPQFARLQQGLISALAPHPDALNAVLRVLREIEDDESSSRPPAPMVIDGSPIGGVSHG